MEARNESRAVIEIWDGDMRWIKYEHIEGVMTYLKTERNTPNDAFILLGKELANL